ncbi:MAG: menaquinone biosynthesis protein [Candidatus Magnetoovum sp. WYHC-5]|nr:menaquinone biosynthesis protein [Candidatus Magnetoovum sp. WYHC-5]
MKIGKINFTNLFPIFYYLEKELALNNKTDYEFIEGTPSEINRLFRDGLVDVGPASCVEYIRNAPNYTLIDGHSISCIGAIKSIMFFSTVEIKRLKGASVLVTAKSETSVALLKIVLNDFYGLEVKTVVSSCSLREGLAKYPAYLLIGDEALSEVCSIGSSLYVYDLGRVWYEKTGLPFVFALWFGRREIFVEDALIEFKGLLDIAREKARSNFEYLANLCAEQVGLSKETLIDYWSTISYDLDKKHYASIELFKKFLAKMLI